MEFLKVAGFNIVRNKKSFFLSAFGIIIGVSIFTFFISLSQGMKKLVNEKIFDNNANFIKIKSQKSLLTNKDIKEIKNYTDVKEVYPMQDLNIPFMVFGSIMGRHFRMEAIAYGMTKEMLKKDLDKRIIKKYKFEYNENNDFVPVVVSREIFEIYNNSYATSHGLPKLAPEILTNYSFTISLGRSMLKTSDKGIKNLKAKIIAVSMHVPLGFAIPLEYSKKWREFYQDKNASIAYDNLVIKARNKSVLTDIKSKLLKNENYMIVTDNNERINFFITVVMMLFVIISLIIVFTSAVNMMQTFYISVNTRLKEIAILRALGAKKSYIRNMILLESLIIGIFSGIVGMSIAFIFTKLIDWYSGNKLPDFPYKPDSFFYFPLWLILIIIPFASIFCLIGAYYPAKKASNTDPAISLSLEQ